MCLYSKTRIPKIATRDIEVYKVVKQKNKELVTPYLGYKVSKIIQTNFIECIKGILNISHIYNKYRISSGFIHSYETNSDAYFNCVFLNCLNPKSNYKILRGIIPKGSLYYKGSDEYCSNKLYYKGSNVYCSNKLILDL